MAKLFYEVCGLRVSCNERDSKINELMGKVENDKAGYFDLYNFYVENKEFNNAAWVLKNLLKYKYLSNSDIKNSGEKTLFGFVVPKEVKFYLDNDR